MRAVVFAYHDMGITGLEALRRCGFEIVQIFTHEDDPGENCWFGSVVEWGEKQRIPIATPTDLQAEPWGKRIASLRPETIFSFYYRYLIPEPILAIPVQGAYNLHGSLLPDYRGRCPVNWVLVNGEGQTGVTLHHMVARADAGDIVGKKAVLIDRTDTARSLYGKLCRAGAGLLDELLPLIREGKAPRQPQDIRLGRYFGGRRPADGRINWNWPAERIYNLVRAVTDPYPGAFGLLEDGERLLIWWAAVDDQADGAGKAPGEITIAGRRVLVQTGKGRLELLDVEGKQGRITGEAIVRYFRDREGTRLT